MLNRKVNLKYHNRILKVIIKNDDCMTYQGNEMTRCDSSQTRLMEMERGNHKQVGRRVMGRENHKLG